MDNYHIAKVEPTLIKQIQDFNKNNAAYNRSMAVFVIPMDNLKSKYESLYQEIPNS